MIFSKQSAPLFLACKAALFIGVLTGAQTVRAEEPEVKVEEAGLPVTFAGFEDKGQFRLYIAEDPYATITHDWRKDGSIEENIIIHMANQTVEARVTIVPDAEGRFKTITVESAPGIQKFEREDSTVSVTSTAKSSTLTLRPETVIFENASPVLISHTIRKHGKAEGQVTFPMLVLNALLVADCTLERLEKIDRSVGGNDYSFIKYKLGLAGVDVFVWADDKGKVYLADIPQQRAAYVRTGFETLRSTDDPDPKLSKPEHEIVEERGVKIPMRDGIDLVADIYRPKAEGKHPVIVVRTPYKKEMYEPDGRFYARRGYVMVVQDCRGRFASAGEWEPFVNEPKDGFDTVEWAAKQDWSNGKVGMIGASYLGWVQWWAAREKPPHLVTIVPNVSPPDPFYNIPYEYGVHFLLGAIWWADILESKATGDLSGVAMSNIAEKKYGELLRSLPVIDFDEKILGKKNKYWRKWIEHPNNDEYWQQSSFLDRLADVKIPVFHQSGWFDGDGIGTKLNYLKMKSHGHPHQKLVLGPWGHTAEAQRMWGDRDFGEAAIIDLPKAYLRWFDHWLKGIDNGIDKEPLVSIFVMGSNQWLHDNVYPLPQTRFEKWYFSSKGSANTSKGDGRLTKEVPPADATPNKYTYDPGDPTPNPQYFERSKEEEQKGKNIDELKKEAVFYHDKVTQARSDIIVFQTDQMAEPMTFAGPLSAVLYASSSAKDTDWFVRLVEVHWDGHILALAEGKIRARFRNSMSKPEMLKPGEIYEYNLDLWQTGITIGKGNRLRVEISSASYPTFSRNLNTGGHNETETEFVKAEQTIYSDAKHPSHILLPIIPELPPKPDKKSNSPEKVVDSPEK